MEFYTKPRPADAGRSAYAYCIQCDSPLTGDEAALNYKYVNRFAKEFLCPVCLGKKMRVTAEYLLEMIVTFRKQGCRMFSPWAEE
jgi:hypothetical protein